MALKKIVLKEEITTKDQNKIISGKKGDTIELSESLADWEVDAGRASYVEEKKMEETKK